jgi:hypothetical protein
VLLDNAARSVVEVARRLRALPRDRHALARRLRSAKREDAAATRRRARGQEVAGAAGPTWAAWACAALSEERVTMRSCCSGIRMYSLVMSSSADRLRFEYAPGTTAEPLLPEASSATRFDFRHTCTRRARASAAARRQRAARRRRRTQRCAPGVVRRECPPPRRGSPGSRCRSPSCSQHWHPRRAGRSHGEQRCCTGSVSRCAPPLRPALPRPRCSNKRRGAFSREVRKPSQLSKNGITPFQKGVIAAAKRGRRGSDAPATGGSPSARREGSA